MITVINEVKDYTFFESGRIIKIKSHWNSSDKVVIQLDSDEYVVFAKDLIAAIENARNVARY